MGDGEGVTCDIYTLLIRGSFVLRVPVELLIGGFDSVLAVALASFVSCESIPISIFLS